MSCYSSGYRKCCNSYIAFISTIMFILSVVIIIVGILQTGRVEPPDSASFGLKIDIS